MVIQVDLTTQRGRGAIPFRLLPIHKTVLKQQLQIHPPNQDTEHPRCGGGKWESLGYLSGLGQHGQEQDTTLLCDPDQIICFSHYYLWEP